MRRMGWRLARNVIGLSLPTIAVVALSVFFYVDKLPEIEKTEYERVKAIYRETALAIQKDRLHSSVEPVQKHRHTGWKPAGKMTPGRWGFSPIPFKRMTWVWYEEGANIYVRCVDYVSETNYRVLFTVFGGFFLLVLVSVTIVGIRYFVRYVKSRDDFLAATAHDLTTPLVGMRMMIGRADDEAKRLNERMLLIVSNIKDFLKLGGKRRQPDLKPVNIVALAKEAYELFAADYVDSESGGVTFDCRPLPSTSTFSVLADEAMTLQILWNLFGNDLKYAAPYGKVAVRFAQEGGFVKVEFIDEGQGMTPRQMKKAFDRYYRAKTVLQSGKGGFGIGLCTAREFARAMGGDLTVRANEPNGCIFTLLLPPIPNPQSPIPNP